MDHAAYEKDLSLGRHKRVFDLVKDFGTSVPHMYISSTSISNVLSPSIMVTGIVSAQGAFTLITANAILAISVLYFMGASSFFIRF